MKRKRLFAAIVMAVLMVSAIGCGGKEEINDENATKTETVENNEEDSENAKAEPAENGENESIGKDFDADVKSGLLWINEQGQVTDKDGNVIDAYSYIIANDRKTLLSENDIMEGYTMTDDMQIIIDESMETWEPEPLESTGNPYLDNLRNNVANPNREGQVLTPVNAEKQSDPDHTMIGQEAEYHSDIIFGNWWVDHQINGTPIANYLPRDRTSVKNTWLPLTDFHFIDQNTCTTEELKRTTPDTSLYAFYLENVQKNQDETGNVYFTGYIDTEFVAVYGNYSNLMNGDNVFVYAEYDGLSIDDVPVFDSGYIEFIQ